MTFHFVSTFRRASLSLAVLLAGLPLLAVAQTGDKLAMPVCVNHRCGVIDQDGKVLLPFDNRYEAVYAERPGRSVFVWPRTPRDGAWHMVSADGNNTLAGPFKDLRSLTTGYYGVSKDGKFGVVDEQGQEVQPPVFDSVYAFGWPVKTVMGYEANGKNGFFDAKGKKITEARYGDPTAFGHLVLAPRDGGQWLINTQTGTERAVAFDDLSESFPDGVRVARHADKDTRGLVDAQGKDLIPQGAYQSLAWAGPGFVAFKRPADPGCGYMDYSGKVVIPPQFVQCEAFGKRGALVQKRAADQSPGPFGLIGRRGEWLQSLNYDDMAPAGLGVMQTSFKQVPGYLSVTRKQGLSGRYGIFNTDEGKEAFAPTRQLMGVLTPSLFVYSDEASPAVRVSMSGSTSQVPSVGLMDASGKPLLKARNFVGFLLDPSGLFVHGYDGIDVRARVGLFDLGGNALIAPAWQKLEVDAARGVVLGYEVRSDHEGHEEREPRAMYDLTGRPAFVVKSLPCGAEQVVDANDKPIWPANPSAYCTRKNTRKK